MSNKTLIQNVVVKHFRSKVHVKNHFIAIGLEQFYESFLNIEADAQGFIVDVTSFCVVCGKTLEKEAFIYSCTIRNSSQQLLDRRLGRETFW